MNSTKLQCKVKIGSAYEPKWFERRYTQGTYSAKNIPPCEETAWLQKAMLGRACSKKQHKAILFLAMAVAVCFLIAYY
jgi:hypothetical protein